VWDPAADEIKTAANTVKKDGLKNQGRIDVGLRKSPFKLRKGVHQ